VDGQLLTFSYSIPLFLIILCPFLYRRLPTLFGVKKGTLGSTKRAEDQWAKLPHSNVQRQWPTTKKWASTIDWEDFLLASLPTLFSHAFGMGEGIISGGGQKSTSESREQQKT
jgi:hypothetical protein